jgi:hydroxymethylpyrimidine pyrophosphatase-like HAD family hydrolase
MAAPAGMGDHMVDYRLLALDYDGTLARSGVIAEPTERALRAAKQAGIRLVLATGREIEALLDACPQIGLFDLVVAENGGLLFYPARGEIEYLAEPRPAELLQELERRGIFFRRGRVILSTWAAQAGVIQDALARLKLDLPITYNKDSAMFLPPGIDKASGLRAGLRRLGVDPSTCVGMGDAENDICFVEVCGLVVAPANAIADLKAVAGLIMTNENGAGVAEFIYQHLLAGDRPGRDVEAVPPEIRAEPGD